MRQFLSNKLLAITFSFIMVFCFTLPLFAQVNKAITTANIQNVTVGKFGIKVPANWQSFNKSESNQLRREFMTQSNEIYRQYSKAPDPARSVDVSAYRISPNAGTLVIVSFTIPPETDLINTLKNQAEDKAKWGIQQGFIKKYLGLTPIDNAYFSGFYVKFIGKNSEVQISGGLEHKNLKNTLIQLSLLCPKSWDEKRATDTLMFVLNYVQLNER